MKNELAATQSSHADDPESFASVLQSGGKQIDAARAWEVLRADSGRAGWNPPGQSG